MASVDTTFLLGQIFGILIAIVLAGLLLYGIIRQFVICGRFIIKKLNNKKKN